MEWPTNYDDFLPLRTSPNTVWSGFYSTRPSSKRLIRETSSYLQAIGRAYSLKYIDQLSSDELISEL